MFILTTCLHILYISTCYSHFHDDDVDQADGDDDGRPARGVDSKEENSNGEHQEANAHN